MDTQRPSGWWRRLGSWPGRTLRRRKRSTADLLLIHGIYWVDLPSQPLRTPICPRCARTRGSDARLDRRQSVGPDGALDGWIVLECPQCRWSHEITAGQEREARGGAARHALARIHPGTDGDGD